MKKAIGAILVLAALVGLLYVFLLDGFVRDQAEKLYIEDEIVEALEENDLYLWLKNETTEFHIGDELVFWVFVGYDPEKYEIDKEGLDYLILDPFKVRSLETYSQTLDEKEIFAAKVTLQCVTCAPGMTHEIKGFRINYTDLKTEEVQKIELDLSIDQPFLFDTSSFDIRGPDYDPVFVNKKPAKLLILGGVVFMVVGAGAIFSRITLLVGRRKKDEVPLSDIDLFRKDVSDLRRELTGLADNDPRIKELVHRAYFGLAGLIYRLRGVDILAPGTIGGLDEKLIGTLEKCKQAYMQEDLIKEEAISILNELSLVALRIRERC